MDTHNDLEMLRRPHLWPHGGRLLPLKRKSHESAAGYDQFAVILYAGKHGQEPHTDENIYMLAPNRLLLDFLGKTGNDMQVELHRGEPPVFGGDFLVRTLVDNGWLVD